RLAKALTAPASRSTLLQRARKRSGGRFTEECLVFDGETTELPEAVPRGDFGHKRLRRCAVSYRPSHPEHPAQQQVVLRSHSEMFVPACVQHFSPTPYLSASSET